ncbi:MAG: hypothetical protein ACE5FL_04015 [Myxococcota bacterium]
MDRDAMHGAAMEGEGVGALGASPRLRWICAPVQSLESCVPGVLLWRAHRNTRFRFSTID